MKAVRKYRTIFVIFVCFIFWTGFSVQEKVNSFIDSMVNDSIHMYQIMEAFTSETYITKEMADELDVHINSINNILNKMAELNIVVKEKKEGTNRITYRYIRIYDTFVEQL